MNSNDAMAFFTSAGNSDDDDWCIVNEEQQHHLWKMFQTDTTLRACRNLLQARLLGSGFCYTKVDSKTSGERYGVPNKIFYDHVQRYYVAFAADFLDCLWVQGVVPYIIVPGTRMTSGLPYPKVIKYDYVSLYFMVDKHYKVRYGIRKKSDGFNSELKKNVMTYVDSDVTSTGLFVSNMSSVMRAHSFVSMIERNTAYSEAVRCRPPVLTRRVTQKTFDSRDLGRGLLMDGALDAERDSQNQQRGNRINIDQFRQQEALVRMLNASRVDTGSEAWQKKLDPATGLPVFDAGGADVYVPDIVPLPNDTEVAPLHLPESRSDLVPIVRLNIEQKAMAMGVPLSILEGSSTRASASVTEMSDNTLAFSLMRLKRSLSETLVDVYRLCFLGQKKGNKNKEDKDEADADQYVADIGVMFPSLQRWDSVKTLFDTGLLSYDAYKEFLKAVFDLTEGDFNTEQEAMNKGMGASGPTAPPMKPTGGDNKRKH